MLAYYQSLFPLVALSAIYWSKDRLIFNRVETSLLQTSQTQRTVLFVLYPSWAFLSWTLALQIIRDDPILYLTTFAVHVVQHLAIVGIFNDSFLQSRKQILAMIVGSSVSFVWSIFQSIFAESVRENERGKLCS